MNMIFARALTFVFVSATMLSPCIALTDSDETDGCLPLEAGSLSIQNIVRLRPTNPSCTRLLEEEKLWKKRLDVTANIYLCDAMNAFANPSGYVYLGQPLINDILAHNGPAFAFQAGGFIVAHEYGHQFQFRILKQREEKIKSGPKLELQADLLAGYWVGMRLREQKDNLEKNGLYGEIDAIKSIAKKMSYDLGDYDFTSPQHHGTPKQRFQAVSIGLTGGFNSKFGEPTDAYRKNGDKIFDWSATKVNDILAGKGGTPDTSDDN